MNDTDRLSNLSAKAAHMERQQRRMLEAIKSAAGQLATIPDDASLQTVIEALRRAAGQIASLKE